VERKFKEELTPLTNTENVFYQLALFVEDPEKYSFNINLFYDYLQERDLITGLRIILEFFQKDTYLIKNKRNAFINLGDFEEDKIFNQKNFSKYLEEKGLNYTNAKINVYVARERKRIKEGKEPLGIVPLADFEIDGTPYWYESTVELFANQLLQKRSEA
jgi:hypothetical protein